MNLYTFLIFIFVNDVYSWNSTFYANVSNFQYNTAIEFISNINLNNNVSILDIGCGNGKITHYIASNITNNDVYGIDNSRSMIKYAKINYLKQNLHFRNVDISNVNISDIIYNKYDTIVSFFCIPWVKDKKNAFKNIAKLSNKGTKIYILGAIFEKNHVKLINNMTEKPYWKPYYINYTSPFEYLNDINYEKYSTESGINVVCNKIFDIKYKFENRDKLRDFNLAILPHIKHLNNENKIKFVNELLDDYILYTQQNDYTITFTLIKFIGVKN
ncbi:unknown similar to AMEV004 [Mythimna separata entomopoxvirus 'L']|uniref:Methyltransferase domain-containing protein n=1 Tax=Mythimna separata entomopoxvirus 'L' TaxID=1293572 RepID=A0A916KQ09_9POXV|nr:unknown similar to AMEV004 [Mythimna separata entomopoxvirus 'L']CCU56237.1 unknown similar to AMEV004 [Mythimna separata entomopoxvirus 'L']